MSALNPSFRNGLYGRLLIAFCLGLYLFQLWEPAKQVRLHSEHLLGALEKKDWSRVGDFVDASYADQWGHDRAELLTRLRQVLPYARNLHLVAREAIAQGEDGRGRWHARLTVEADPNEISE